MKQVLVLLLLASFCWSYQTKYVSVLNEFTFDGIVYEKLEQINKDSLGINEHRLVYEYKKDSINYFTYLWQDGIWGDPIAKSAYLYDNGKISKMESLIKDGSDWIPGSYYYEYGYNTKGLLSSSTVVYPETNRTNVTIVEYYSDNNIDQVYSISNEGDTTISQRYNYINDSRYELLMFFDSTGEARYKFVVDWAGNNNDVFEKQTTFVKEGNNWKKKTDYVQFLNGKSFTDSIHNYDADTLNTRILMDWSKSNDELLQTQTNFSKDSLGNWYNSGTFITKYRVKEVGISVFKDKSVPYTLDVKKFGNKMKLHFKGAHKIYGIKMFDLKGRKLISRNMNPASEVDFEIGDESLLSSGRYVFEVLTDEGIISFKALLLR